MGTTKLTRKEILAEDSVHGSIVLLVEFFRTHRKIIAIFSVIAVLLGLGVYGGLVVLKKKETQAQEILGRGIDFYHAEIDPEASEDPYGSGPVPEFKSDTLKYEAAEKEFSSIVSGYGYPKVSHIARYYLGLTQLKLGRKDEAVENLKKVSDKSKGRTIGYLAQNVLVRIYASDGQYEEARKILEVLMADAQYHLPREELRIQLSRVLTAEGKDEEAVKVLQEGVSEGSALSPFRQTLMDELDKVKKEMQLKSQP